MDFKKIQSEALSIAIDISLKEIINNRESNNQFEIKDKELKDDVTLIKLLQKFSAQVATETIKIYHEELKKELAKNGINI